MPYLILFPKPKKYYFLLFSFLLSAGIPISSAQKTIPASSFTIARIKYGGGGDWYGNTTSLGNILAYTHNVLKISVGEKEATVTLDDEALFNYPVLYIAGHGNIKFTDSERQRLRDYLTNGGFLFADDDYGMDKPFRREMKAVFPDKEWIEIPFSHGIYQNVFKFPSGLPKIHEHDGGPPHGYGLFHEGRLIAFYSFNTDISDGCEDPGIHPEDTPEKHEQALKIATNIIAWVLSN